MGVLSQDIDTYLSEQDQLQFDQDMADIAMDNRINAIIDSYLNEAAESVIGCPYDVVSCVLNDDTAEEHALLLILNKAYSLVLKDVNVEFKFIHLENEKRKTIWTKDHCETSIAGIISMVHRYGYLKDFVALEHIMSMRKLECQVFFNGLQLFTK